MSFESGVERLVRPELLAMEGYAAVEPMEVLSQYAGIPVEEVVKLDGNENPYGPSPRVGPALASYPYYHIYPDPTHRQLRRALEGYVGLDASHLVVGSGSDELIDLIMRLFLRPGDGVINCPPTFPIYPFKANVCGGRLLEVPRDTSHGLDFAGVKRACQEGAKLIFLASPNNPTGNVVPEAQVRELLETGIVVVVDEAYYEFSGITVAPLVPHFHNLIVLRSFSKWAGLAGLRVGYGVFPPKLAELIMKIKLPYNVNIAAQVAALESLADLEYLQGTIKALVAERSRLFAKLGELGFLKPYPSQANFILCDVTGKEAKSLHRGLRERGIFIRYYDTPLLRNCLRVSVGKPEHTDALIAALKEVGAENDRA
ncbi:MAG TPA: histidinol-phosphate transaminase [Dehalococcoidia bacterium]|nr:histidinol-phosphate transaminase [Dehalococcoidia bacterium]